MPPTVEEGSQGSAPFNMAVASLQRLHNWRVQAAMARASCNINLWFSSLQNQFSEVCCMCQLEASEKAKFYDLRSKVCHRINEHNNSKPCLEKKYGKCPHFNNLFWLLDEFDIFLSELAEQHKLCMPAKADVAAHMQEGFA